MKQSIVVASLMLAATMALAPTVSAQQPRDSMRPRTDSAVMRMRQMRDSTDARLDSLVRAMNSTTGDRKVQAMASVINELVAERRMMHQHMREMMGTGGMRRHPGMRDPGMMRRRSTTPPPAADSAARR